MAKGFGKGVMTSIEEPEAEILRKSVIKHFQHLEDPRVGSRKAHSLVAIITIANKRDTLRSGGVCGNRNLWKSKA
ncbi:hypothetical protein [Moorena sp. SIO3I8]|uniref:hypothetical protein n=1 Tax=Moorena sp. SIO3I8 TaxID=2607833 RepID=UPI0013C11738|nr:hypothetical protein [Moorena sp. SIO3I8]NEO09597.1 transposase family protein [Moorena sp. SIO3I8]